MRYAQPKILSSNFTKFLCESKLFAVWACSTFAAHSVESNEKFYTVNIHWLLLEARGRLAVTEFVHVETFLYEASSQAKG